MIFKVKPKQFNPRFEVVSCFVECDGEILLLHRWPEKSQGNKWGVPAGKIEPGETPLQAMVRETKEETDVMIDQKDLTYFKKVFVRYPDYDFVYHMFHIQFTQKPKVTLNPKEHQNFVWVWPRGALLMEIMPDLDACIKLFYEFSRE